MTENDFGFRMVDEETFNVKPDPEIAQNSENLLEQMQILSAKFAALDTNLMAKIDDLDRYSSGPIELSGDKKILISALEELKTLSIGLLTGLMENPDKEYIHWPNRGVILQSKIDKVNSITKDII